LRVSAHCLESTQTAHSRISCVPQPARLLAMLKAGTKCYHCEKVCVCCVADALQALKLLLLVLLACGCPAFLCRDEPTPFHDALFCQVAVATSLLPSHAMPVCIFPAFRDRSGFCFSLRVWVARRLFCMHRRKISEHLTHRAPTAVLVVAPSPPQPLVLLRRLCSSSRGGCTTLTGIASARTATPS
jgi:hypothetical protein